MKFALFAFVTLIPAQVMSKPTPALLRSAHEEGDQNPCLLRLDLPRVPPKNSANAQESVIVRLGHSCGAPFAHI